MSKANNYNTYTNVTYSNVVGLNKYCNIELLTAVGIPAANISWVHCISLQTDTSFLQPGNFVVLNGLTPKDIPDIYAFILQMKSYSLSGILLSMYKFSLSESERTLLSQAGNAVRLPVLFSHNLLKAVDFCKDICQHIVHREQFCNIQEQIIYALLTQPSFDKQAIINMLFQLGYSNQASYVTAVFRVHSQNGHSLGTTAELSMLQDFYVSVCSFLTGCFTCGSFFNNYLVMILPESYMGTPLKDILMNLISKTVNKNSRHIIRGGCGSRWSNIDGFRKSFDIAIRLSRLPHRYSFLDVEDQIIFRVLCQFDNANELFAIYLHLFGPLLDYDKENHYDLMKCLKAYLENNQNLQASANQLYLHVNTYRNRIAKVEELLGCDFRSDRWCLFRYYFGFFVEDYLFANTNLLANYSSHSYLSQHPYTR